MRAVILFGALGALGCTVPVGSTGEPIIGGATDSGDPSVMLLIGQRPNSASASLCTASVISPHVLLTAAHCVDPAVLMASDYRFSVFPGGDISSLKPADLLSVKETHFDPQFNPSQFGLTNGHDIAVVIMANALSQAPLPVNRAPLQDSMVGQPLRIVGYGVSDGNDTSGQTAGVRRSATTVLDSLTANFVKIGDPSHNTCEGDSGGPAFLTINGVEQIVGITSFGTGGCTTDTSDTRLDVFGSFVDPYVHMYDPSGPDMATPPGPVGAPCSSGNDCASQLCTTGGVCTAICDPKVASSCPAGSACTAQSDGSGICLPTSGSGHGGCAVAVGGSTSSALVAAALALVLALAAVRRRLSS
jgi:MYXO-CTERM domain-containing protein